MEILSQTNHYFEFYGYLLILLVFCLFFGGCTVAFYYSIFKEKDYSLNTISGTVVFTIMTIVLICGLVLTINENVRITYKAKVSDWNEVYDQGYKVVERNDNTVTLEKDKK